MEQILNNPQGVTFTTLFVGLLVYVMKTNDNREKNYRDTISELTKALNTFEDLKDKVESLVKKVI
jgi:YbbR domain-containing protein